MSLRIRFSPAFLNLDNPFARSLVEFYNEIMPEQIENGIKIWSKQHNVDFHSIKIIHQKEFSLIDVLLPSDRLYIIFSLTWNYETKFPWNTMYKVIRD